MKKPDWLCNLCWDKREIIIHGTTSTTPAIEHLAEYHKINKSGQIPDTGSVLQQVQGQAQAHVQAENTEEKDPTISCVFQVDLNAFKAALIRWIIVAHMALSCVEVDAFRDLVRLLNPAISAFLYKAGDSIRRLIISEYEKRKERVRQDLRQALSKNTYQL
jgi:hypothetical protein